jgi:cytochrome c554/c'-like protein
LTSAPSNEKNILGSFEAGENVFAFDPFTDVRMEKRDSGFYQVEYNNGKEIRQGRFDVVVGSGRKGQSYLSWINNRLVQLPITYFSPEKQWSNSPGYPPHTVAFYRPITSRCLECHSTYFEKTSDPSAKLETFDHHNIIYAVDCEKCHGPAAEHVKFHSENPSVKGAKFIVNPGKLSRERLLDLCALCHGGPLTKTKPSFQFQAGDTLSNYFSLQAVVQNADNIDVHGNQQGLLSLSKCFVLGKVTCISCHNVHENENGKIEIFSQRCVNCHSEGHEKICKMTNQIGPSITQNCIDCHMPKQLSHAVAVYLQGADAPTPALMRTHYIKTYANETQKILNLLKKQNSSRKQP